MPRKTLQRISTSNLRAVSGGAKQYPPDIASRLAAAKKQIADNDTDADKARVKGNVVQIHYPDDLGGSRGSWVPFPH
jgi:hypothetical protein